ncbi:D-sedoheptulose 7-phosphate isomerase [Galbibacter sp. BG1]|uniref:D-sedoheptulose 7-phosphate isomerase n=1 Tax=Galbibacter sp. BG1 TaxID=1170699 RepID=UPI0015BDD016|nr:D-sedoheptulose 7-phosphate isomerase [Galbibacter sp. BG1]QLE02211.1 D-sedoheptulose 7-phosphate isomerase [Galbibacter sp. BG1]
MENLEEQIKHEFAVAQDVLSSFMKDNSNFTKIVEIATLMTNAMKSGNKIISCGNGGSHCDAMHFAEELTGRYRENRKALPAIAISDPSHISCISNDYGYEFVFSRFVESLGKKGDVLLGISTSGNSKSIVEAFQAAKNLGIKTVLLSGESGGKLRELADMSILVPHTGYADRIQEIHIKIIHTLILTIEKLIEKK